jgi:hypothetical protein
MFGYLIATGVFMMVASMFLDWKRMDKKNTIPGWMLLITFNAGVFMALISSIMIEVWPVSLIMAVLLVVQAYKLIEFQRE